MITDFKKAVRQTMGTALAIQLLSAISGVLIARAVGPEGRGLYATVLVYPLLISSVVGLGFGPYLARMAAQSNGDLKRSLDAQALTLAFLQAVTGVLLVGLIYSLSWPRDPVAAELVLWFSVLWLPLNQFTVMLTSLDQGKEEWRRYNSTRFVIFLANFAILVGLWAMAMLTVFSALASMAIANGVAVFLRLRVINVKHGCEWVGIKTILCAIRGGFPFAAVSVTTILSSQADVLLATSVLERQQAGLYVVALAVAQLLAPLSRSVGQVVFTHSARAHSPTQRTSRGDVLARRVLIMFAVFLIISASIAAILSPLIVTVYGSAFKGAVPIGYVMIPGGVAIAVSTLLEEHLKGVGCASSATKALWMALFVYFILGYPSIKLYGPIGLAAVFSLAQYLRLIGLLYSVTRVENICWLTAGRQILKR